jgi:hypothetical protein
MFVIFLFCGSEFLVSLFVGTLCLILQYQQVRIIYGPIFVPSTFLPDVIFRRENISLFLNTLCQVLETK